MLQLNRRHAVVLGLAAGVCAPMARASTAADAGEMLALMTGALQSQGSLSFQASLDFGGSAGAAGRRTLGTRVQAAYQRPGRLLARYGDGGDLVLAAEGSKATLFRASKAAKAVLPVTPGLSAFSVDGLFLPFLGLFAADVSKALLGEVRSITLLSQGLPDQTEETVLIAVLSSLFTGEIWISKGSSLPTRIIGTFFDGAGGTAASARLDFSNWSTAPLAPSAFDVPGFQEAREVTLDALER